MDTLENPRDKDGRLLCPICDEPIRGTQAIIRVGEQALHFKCHDHLEKESTSESL
jgi:hypothetical protein